MSTPDTVERLQFFAARMEAEGHLNAARHMRNAADELECLRIQAGGAEYACEILANTLVSAAKHCREARDEATALERENAALERQLDDALRTGKGMR